MRWCVHDTCGAYYNRKTNRGTYETKLSYHHFNIKSNFLERKAFERASVPLENIICALVVLYDYFSN